MYGEIFLKAWQIMQHEITINNFTFSYADVFLFDLLCILVVRAIFVIIDIKG